MQNGVERSCGTLRQSCVSTAERMQLSALLRRWARGNVLDSPVLAKKARSSRRGCGSRCARAVAFFGGEPGSRGRAVADGAAGGRGKAASKQAITAGPAERRVGRVCAERYGCWRVGWRMSGEHDAHGPVRRVGRLVRPIEADPVYVSYIEPCLRVRPQKKVYLKSAPRTLALPRPCLRSFPDLPNLAAHKFHMTAPREELLAGSERRSVWRLSAQQARDEGCAQRSCRCP